MPLNCTLRDRASYLSSETFAHSGQQKAINLHIKVSRNAESLETGETLAKGRPLKPSRSLLRVVAWWISCVSVNDPAWGWLESIQAKRPAATAALWLPPFNQLHRKGTLGLSSGGGGGFYEAPALSPSLTSDTAGVTEKLREWKTAT